MRSSKHIPLFVFFFVASAFAFSQSQPKPNANAKNVLFLIADDLNCDLQCYGDPQVQTPNIDKLASRGVLFERAYCQFPLCSPSRSSFLTGRRPNATKIHTNPKAGRASTDYTATPHFREFIPDTVTLPQLYRLNGYRSVRVGKLYHYGVPAQIGTSGLDDLASWDLVVNPAGRDKSEEHKIFSLTPGSYGGSLSWLATAGNDLEHTDGLSATAAISLLNEFHDNKQPFFLAVGFFRPHTPYVAPAAYFDRYPTSSISLPELSEDDRTRDPAPAYASAKKEQEEISDDQRRKAIQAYHASITFMDSQVGRVLDELDRLGMSENTVVVMTSDHGYHMYQHGLWQKMSLFENSARVPLIIAAPGLKAKGKRTKALAELVDLYPTLAGISELKAPDYLNGVSLQPILSDPNLAVKDAAFTQLRRGNFDGYSIRTDRYRYTLWDKGTKGEQLYDMEKDPTESKNLANNADMKTTISELREKLMRYAGNE
jgi:iduronate 2-sulfatase